MSESRITNYAIELARGIRWLHRPGGAGLQRSRTGLFDSVLGDAVDAAKESMLVECTDKALDYHARNTNDRRVLGETSVRLRAYLRTRWTRRKESGTEDGLRYQMGRLGYSQVEFWSWQRLKLAGVPGATAFGGRVGFWFCIIRQPHPFIGGPLYDGGDLYDGGSFWGLGLFGGGDPAPYFQEIDFCLHRWRPSGRSPRFVVIDLDGSTQVLTTSPYDFTGNYVTIPLFEAGEKLNVPPASFYSSSFVNA